MAICIINRPDPGEKLGNNQGMQSILDLIFNNHCELSQIPMGQRSCSYRAPTGREARYNYTILSGGGCD